MNGYVFLFELEHIDETKRQIRVAAYSKQMAWIQAAAYVSCHVSNPAICGIKLVKEQKIAPAGNPAGNLHEGKCSEAYAISSLLHM